MTILNEIRSTTTEINDYGVNVTTNTITKVFASMDEVRHDVGVAKPLYLKHAHPRTGTRMHTHAHTLTRLLTRSHAHHSDARAHTTKPHLSLDARPHSALRTRAKYE